MKKIERIRKNVNNYLFDHIYLKEGLHISGAIFIAAFSAMLYAFGFYCFISPAHIDATTIAGSSIVTGGVGGISQVISLALRLGGVNHDIYILQSILYFAINIPIFIFAFLKIGKKFAILTAINVGLSSMFIQLFANVEFTRLIAQALEEEHVARVLFAGTSVGIASALAFKGDFSCGGIDVFSYYFSLRKSTSVGKYATALNSTIIITYTILTIFLNTGNHVEVALLNFLYSVLYLFVVMFVVDFINTRNKKVRLEIITNVSGMSAVLIANFPHSTTVVKGEGGYSHNSKDIIHMVVSSNESKKVIDLVRKVDPHSFVMVSALIQTYGNFFVKPIE